MGKKKHYLFNAPTGQKAHTYGDNFPIGSVDKRILAVHVVEVREVSLFDLTDDRDQEHTAGGFVVRHCRRFSSTAKASTEQTSEFSEIDAIVLRDLNRRSNDSDGTADNANATALSVVTVFEQCDQRSRKV